MRELLFNAARVRVYADHIETRFYEDGSISRFYPPVGKEDFEGAARYAGYADSLRFGLEHDILHHYLSESLGWERSYVVWWAAHGEPHDPDTQGWRDLEEHVVIRMQRYWHTGEIDDDFGVLAGHFGRNLIRVAHESPLVCRPWISTGD
jgi:hypothetical protein